MLLILLLTCLSMACFVIFFTWLRLAIWNVPYWILINIVKLLVTESPQIRWCFRLEQEPGYNICYVGLGTTTVRDFYGWGRFICRTHRPAAIDILRTLYCPLYRKCKQHQCYQQFLGLPYKFDLISLNVYVFILIWTIQNVKFANFQCKT